MCNRGDKEDTIRCVKEQVTAVGTHPTGILWRAERNMPQAVPPKGPRSSFVFNHPCSLWVRGCFQGASLFQGVNTVACSASLVYELNKNLEVDKCESREPQALAGRSHQCGREQGISSRWCWNKHTSTFLPVVALKLVGFSPQQLPRWQSRLEQNPEEKQKPIVLDLHLYGRSGSQNTVVLE